MDLLKVLVGSRAHGLENENSDSDVRGVFATPTSELLSLGPQPKQIRWVEHEETRERPDDTAWEVGKFLFLATKCNPTILEVFLAPVLEANTWGQQLRELFPCVWNSKGVKDAFIGYGLNQRKKFLDNADNRAPKYAAAYLRTLFSGWQLLTTGTFIVRIVDTEIGATARRFKSGEFESFGEVIDVCNYWQGKMIDAFNDLPKKETELEPVNEYLLALRRDYWRRDI